MNETRDYTGQRYGRLVFVRRDHVDANSMQHWVMRCDCGTEFVTTANNVLAGHTRSCGCARRTMMLGNQRARKFANAT